MYIKELWRYPVKSLGGERIEENSVRKFGLTGDRLVFVQAPDGQVVTSRSHPKLLALKGSLDENCQPRINKFKWTAPEALELIRVAAGPAATLVYSEGPERFDVLPTYRELCCNTSNRLTQWKYPAVYTAIKYGQYASYDRIRTVRATS